MATRAPERDRADETRRRILDEAARVFAERGYHGASISDVLEATGLTKGALYFHFPSKEALALAAFADVQERWVSSVLAATDRRSSAMDQLRAMLEAAIAFAETQPAAGCTNRLATELSQDSFLRPRLAPFITRWEEMIEMLVRQGQQEGNLRSDVDPRSAARLAVAAFVGSEHTSWVTSGGEDLRDRAGDVLRLHLDSLAKRTEDGRHR
ncbi:MAG TPA: ScbR family autoregulator-binding transcription factor [Actinomycetota bacterium]|nr:ScbR family autoregulator-binding transcription factor [Actinomycetota bacterium]